MVSCEIPLICFRLIPLSRSIFVGSRKFYNLALDLGSINVFSRVFSYFSIYNFLPGVSHFYVARISHYDVASVLLNLLSLLQTDTFSFSVLHYSGSVVTLEAFGFSVGCCGSPYTGSFGDDLGCY